MVAAAVAGLFAFLLLAMPQTAWADSQMHRMYNMSSGEHFYTASGGERDVLRSAGWHYEGVAWTAPDASSTPVYRLYNPNTGDHHYTTSAGERDMLSAAGWNAEGVGWYSDDARRVPLYRLYNPNAVAGSHHYTTSAGERDQLVRTGWRDEGIGWYGTGGAIPGTGDPAPAPQPSVTPQPNPGASQLATVYVTPSGTKFHRQSCPTLSRSKKVIAMSRSDAERSGRGACKDCRP